MRQPKSQVLSTIVVTSTFPGKNKMAAGRGGLGTRLRLPQLLNEPGLYSVRYGTHICTCTGFLLEVGGGGGGAHTGVFTIGILS